MDEQNKEPKKGFDLIKFLAKPQVRLGLGFLVVVTIVTGLSYWYVTSGRIYTDKADIEAPTIVLAPDAVGTLEQVFVNEGDMIPANTLVARVGNELIKTKDESIVINVMDNIGANVNPGQAVVSVINPNDLRVVGQVQEDKGLRDIKIGQKAIFTVDAFGSKKYQGIVDEISPTARAGDIVFNISGQRQEQSFDVKIRFNADQYPELKNGMSAKLWIYK